MSRFRFATIFGLFVFLWGSPPPVFGAFDPVAVCQKSFQQTFDDTLTQLQQLEEDYAHYRWREAEIRRHFYERLWRARHDALDPLSKEQRQEGGELNADLEEDLKELKKKSREASNRFRLGLEALQQQDIKFQRGSRERDFQTCIRQSYQPVYELLGNLGTHFEHIFEREREYRTIVETLSGGPEGLYPADTLESPEVHRDYYGRLQRDRESIYFQEDAAAMDFFYQIRRALVKDFSAASCCYQKSVAAYDIEEDR